MSKTVSVEVDSHLLLDKEGYWVTVYFNKEDGTRERVNRRIPDRIIEEPIMEYLMRHPHADPAKDEKQLVTA